MEAYALVELDVFLAIYDGCANGFGIEHKSLVTDNQENKWSDLQRCIAAKCRRRQI